MKATELRIGNWIYQQGLDNQVTDLTWRHGEFETNGTIINGECDPIPLTEEWLVKFGFTPQDKTKHANFYKIFLDEKQGTWLLILSNLNYWIGYGNDFGEESVGLGELEYVHQLQNLYFALTGEELTIKE